MKVLLILAVVAMLTTPSTGQELTDAQRLAYSNAAAGTEFWLVVPPNERLPYQASSLDVYLSSAFETSVEVFDAQANSTYRRALDAGSTRTLSDSRGETNWNWELRDYETVVKKGIKFTADEVFTLSYLNNKVYTSEGTTVLPVSSWGSEYIITSYYDYNENRPWGGGFCIVASQNNTQVTIALDGEGDNTNKTQGGRKLGDSWTITLDEGEVYCVMGDATTRAYFDLTGTRVTANVPIGVVNFHQRTTMPNSLPTASRDHLVEWALPLDQWSTNYVSMQLKRDGTRDLGDIMRIVAAEDNTQWQMVSRYPATGTVIRRESGILQAGETATLFQVTAPVEAVRGVTEWTSSKPTMVVQYSASANFDGDQIHDPFQVNLLPEDRWATAVGFQIPTSTDFAIHNAMLVFRLDPDDPELDEKLSRMTLNGEEIEDLSVPNLSASNVPGTDLWSTTIPLGQELQSQSLLTGEVPASVFLYGFGRWNSYGWWLGALHPNIVGQDTLPPALITVGQSESSLVVNVRDTVDLSDPDSPLKSDQIDAGIARVILSEAKNVRLSWVEPLVERRPEAGYASFILEAIEPTKPASATVLAYDYAGNVSRLEHVFIAEPGPKIATSTIAHFGTVQSGSVTCSETIPLIVSNVGDALLSFSLESVTPAGSQFAIEPFACDESRYEIQPGDSVVIPCICITATTPGEQSAVLKLTTNDPDYPSRFVTLRALVVDPVSVEEENDNGHESNINVTATPGALEVRCATSESGRHWVLVDILGAVVRSGTIKSGDKSFVVSTSGLAAGTYVVSIEGVGSRVILAGER